MKYIKLFENFMQSGAAGPATMEPGPSSLPETKPGQRFSVEDTPLYAAVLNALNKRLSSDSEFANLYDELERKLSRNKDVYSLFVDTEYSSSLIDAELPKHKMTSERYRRFFENNIPNPDLQKMAKDALINIGLLGALGLAIKLFYMLGEATFMQLNQSGFSSVAGGVILVLIYLAFFKKAKKVEDKSNDDDFEVNEKRSKKEGSETLRATSFAYVPDKDKPSTWKLRIDDANHTRAAVAALGKGFRGNKVRIPADEKDSVIRKVRAAYKKFYPEKVKEEGYPKALELK